VVPTAGREDLSYVVIEASADLLEETAQAQPVLVVIEDLHWADDLSVGVLAAIVRRAAVSTIGVIGSLRPSPRPPALDRLIERVGDALGVHLRLGALDEIDVHALATAIAGASPGHGLRERLRGTAGNPLYVVELLRSFEDDGLLRVEDGIADVTPGVRSMSLNETLVRRLSWLPRETTDLLRMASLLGSGFTLSDLATITGRPVIDVAAWLREASLAGLVVGDGDRLTFRHDLVREAVYGYMLPAERRDLHRAAGKALASADAPTQQVAEQYARGARANDVEAVGWLERAAIETISVSPSNAVALLQQALSLAPSHWPARAALQARMIEPLTWCGRFDDAEAIATTILSSSPAADVEYQSLRGLAAAQGNRGQTAAAIATLQRAAAAPGAPADEARQLRCLAAQLSMMTAAISVDTARQFAEETLTAAVDDGDATTQCLAHQVLGIAAAFTGHSVLSRDHLSAALALLDSGQVTAASYLIPETFQAMGLLELDAIDDAIVVADNGRKRADRTGALAFLPLAYLAAASARLYAGRWDDALAEIEAGLAVVGHTGSYLAAVYYEAILAKVALHRGDLAKARAHLDVGAQRLADGVGFFGVDWLFGAMAESLAADGRLEKALTVAEATWVQTAPARYVYGHRPRGIALVRLAVAAGRDDLARTVTAELEEGARRSPAASAAGAALQCRSLVERDPDLALEAVARYRETPLRPDVAACCEDAAGVLAAAGRRDEAVELLRDAVAIYADLDAGGDIIRVERALRGLGVRLPRGRPSRPSFGWESLTPTELEVSRLVAEGLSNPDIGARLYISRRTVETHLSHVFTKLGLASRSHLAAEFTRRAPAR
jgi:DNA-binding CsgD family transcriptional regulator